MNKILPIILFCFAHAFSYDFMTWNVRCENPDDTLNGNIWSKRLPHIVEAVVFINPDFFNVQEVNPNFVKDLENALPEYNHVYLHEKSQNAIFYKKRFSVQKTGEFYLSETPNKRSRGWDAKNKRTCLWAKIQDENRQTFFIFNTHFDHKGKEARINSALMLKDSISNIAGNATVLLSGDFNVDKREKPFTILNESGFLLEAQFQTKRIYNPSGSVNYFDPKRYSQWQFDYIFTSKNLEVIRYSVPNFIYYDKDTEVLRFPSDHSPAVIQFNIQ